MNWGNAVKKIEQAQAEGALNILIRYHVKWMKEWRMDTVDDIITYDWHGQTCKAINTFHDQLNEGSHIIDEVIPDFFFQTKEDLKKGGE